jgi:hypothetical protein
MKRGGCSRLAAKIGCPTRGRAQGTPNRPQVGNRLATGPTKHLPSYLQAAILF